MDTDTKEKDLTAAVLGRIEEERVIPHSRLYFVAREAGVWSLWLLTVLVGALAIAVTVAVGAYRYATGYELTHESFFGYAAEVLPYLWILVFSAMTFLAVYNLRHTKHGYRYSVFVIVGSSVLGSVGGGLLLHLVGFGFTLDHLLGTYVPSYQSQDKIELRMWQQPEAGRLVGVSDGRFLAPEGTLRFVDMRQGEWSLVVRELPPQDRELLLAGDPVRLFGELVSLTPPVFYACGALPWLKEKLEERRQMGALRREFKARMMAHHFAEEAEEREEGEGVHCAEVGGVRRLREEAEELVPSLSY